MSQGATYVKRVSFDDLAPSFIDDQIQLLKKEKKFIGFNNQFIHVPPQYNPLFNGSTTSSSDISPTNSREGSAQPNTCDLNTTSASSNDTKIHNMYNSLFVSLPGTSLKKSSSHDVLRERSISPFYNSEFKSNRARLPPPPKIPSIKDKPRYVDEQVEIQDVDISNMDFNEEKEMEHITNRNTVDNSGSRKVSQAAFSNLNEVEDRISNSSKLKLPITNSQPDGPPKRKSFAGMSLKELEELESSYSALGRSTKHDINNFDFGKQDTLFIGKIKSKNSPASLNASTNFKDPFAALYPSRPSVNHRAISMTEMHRDYKEYISNSIHSPIHHIKDNCSIEHTRGPRVILCYISGKRYTWSSVDWFIQNEVADGDHLVIVSTIPDYEEKIKLSSISSSSSTSSVRNLGSKPSYTYSNPMKDFPTRRNSYASKEGSLEISESSTLYSSKDALNNIPNSMRLEAIHDRAVQKANKILKYYSSKLQDKIIKVTVEIIKDSSKKDALARSIALYKPDWQIISTVSANLQIKFRNGKVKLPFFLMKHAITPTCVIPYEFMDPGLVDHIDEPEKFTRKSIAPPDKMKWVSETIKKTLNNPYLRPELSTDGTDAKSFDSVEDEDDIVADSINEYYPITPDIQRKMDLFERIGYVRPTPCRQENLSPVDSVDGRKMEPVTSRSSGRSSRIQFQDDCMYKVRSLIPDSDVEPHTDDMIRKTKSSVGPTLHTQSSKTSSSSSKHNKSKERKANFKQSSSQPNMTHHSKHNVSSIKDNRERNDTKEQGKGGSKKGFGSLFKKVFH
ncbi:hypothetical protein Kpol_1050p67 [Vanderwaltozyma polyspora DSM 70294]|uniref:Uncharacterized protein n=1 Tax=Vanderwaltozyma polyspora (strain ATCC 22028 / DSM 70294 / BCRC 21397 / CBS 2163 / NBRC 10782 / NRRL Y-8283 / UCD 57-17) TaxID=436907 RepID=A7TEW3_VANPO|nr:uncharacterized protein Kpol_1050p67 [Vanderwaltozyma polyspora DSM 70294]EDO19209.1 hypothetical protein Kpol_1050p67 [Vanderwaltozyma polyspora DSM 70294]